MEFVLLKMVPITRGQIPARLLALLYGYSFVTLALFFYSKVIKKRRNYGTVRKGINNLAIQLEDVYKRQLDGWAMGTGAMIGATVFVASGLMAGVAGPASSLSFVIRCV